MPGGSSVDGSEGSWEAGQDKSARQQEAFPSIARRTVAVGLVPAGIYRELRHLVQLRDSHVQQMTASKFRIKALLLYEGIEFPEIPGNGQSTRPVLKRIATLPCKDSVRFKLDSLLATLAFHKDETLAALKQIRKFCEQEEELRQSINYLFGSRNRLDYCKPLGSADRRLAAFAPSRPDCGIPWTGLLRTLYRGYSGTWVDHSEW